MANLLEWIKGIIIFIFINIVFYLWWTNIFSNLIEWVGTDMLGIGASAVTSLAILKTFAWISFILLYLTTAPVYLIYSIIQGSSGNAKTNPIDLLIGLGVWMISMPLLIIFYGVFYYIQSSLSTATSTIMDSASITIADQITWLLGLVGIIIITVAPFYFILRGYGLNLFGNKVNEGLGGTILAQ